jgi:hypothetical protein
MSDSGSDLAVLTPEMFLYELDETGVPEIDLNTDDLKIHFTLWKNVKRLKRVATKIDFLNV